MLRRVSSIDGGSIGPTLGGAPARGRERGDTRVDRDHHDAVPFDVERLLRLWTDPLPEDDGLAAESFRALYVDPVRVNGAPLTAVDLVARARRMQAALEEPEREVLAVADAGTAVAVVFRLAGRQVGPLDTPAGALPPTGSRIDLRVIDVLTVTDGRVSAIWMAADWLPVLAAAGLLRMPDEPGPAVGGADGRLPAGRPD